jgi:CBS domain-containing protein
MTRRTPAAGPRLALEARTAADLMTPNPVSLRSAATVPEAVALLTDRGFSAAPVIDAAGRPVGVLSRTDLLVHEREQGHHAAMSWEADLESPLRPAREGFSVEVVDPTRVRDIMTPVVFTVGLHAPAREAVEQMLALKVHQLFVVDKEGALVGVISALDVLRHLRPE